MLPLKKVKWTYQLIVFLLFFGFSLFLQKNVIREFPHHIHAWAHTDHYALSKGFLNNNFDFFHPETLTANKQFPSTKDPGRLSKVTSSDFPLIQYTAAMFMKISGSEAPIVYRLWMLILSCIGLLFLFKIAYHFSSNYVVSCSLPVLILFSPVYLDYQVGFLPSMGAMTLLFVGIYHYILFNDKGTSKHLVLASVFLSLAAAIRMPFAIPLLAIIGYQVLNMFNGKTKLKTILILGGGLILPLLYFFYNQYLRAEYGSIFLGTPLYARNLTELKTNFVEAWDNWNLHYFNQIQWIFIITSVLALVVLRLLRQNIQETYKRLLDISFIYGIGVILYLILMSRQMVHHDYYSLDTFIPFVALIAVIVTSTFVRFHEIPYFASGTIGLLLVFSLLQNTSLLEERRSTAYSEPYTTMLHEYEQLDQLLADNGLQNSQDSILVWDYFAPNMPFLLSNTSGANLLLLESTYITNSLSWDYNYIIVRDDLIYGEMGDQFNVMYKNTQLIDYQYGIFLLKKTPSLKESQTTLSWMGIDAEKPIDSVVNYESIDDVILTDEQGTCSTEFGMTYKKVITTNEVKVISFQCRVNKLEESEAFWHLHIRSDEQELFNQYIQIEMDENLVSKEIILPRDLNTWHISSYLYNPNKNTIYYRDFEVKYY